MVVMHICDSDAVEVKAIGKKDENLAIFSNISYIDVCECNELDSKKCNGCTKDKYLGTMDCRIYGIYDETNYKLLRCAREVASVECFGDYDDIEKETRLKKLVEEIDSEVKYFDIRYGNKEIESMLYDSDSDCDLDNMSEDEVLHIGSWVEYFKEIKHKCERRAKEEIKEDLKKINITLLGNEKINRERLKDGNLLKNKDDVYVAVFLSSKKDKKDSERLLYVVFDTDTKCNSWFKSKDLKYDRDFVYDVVNGKTKPINEKWDKEELNVLTKYVIDTDKVTEVNNLI